MHEVFFQHPLLRDKQGREQLPATIWHSKVQDRYPKGSTAELFRRSQTFFYRDLAKINGNDQVLIRPPMQPKSELLDGLTGPAIDIIAPTLIVEQNGKQKTIVIMEDHVHQGETSYTMGKSTIAQRLLNIPAVDEIIRKKLGLVAGEKVSAEEIIKRMDQTIFEANKRIDIHQETATAIKLLTGDVTFIGKSTEGTLVALPTVGTKEDFIFDLSRASIRRLITNYNRLDDNIMRAQIDISEKIRLSDSIWADTNAIYPVDEIIYLTPNSQLDAPAAWTKATEFNSPEVVILELQNQLSKNPTYIANEIGYWDLDQKVHARQVEELLSGTINSLPKVRYLQLKDPKNPAVLEFAVSLLKKEYLKNNKQK